MGKPVCYVSRMELDPGKSTIRSSKTWAGVFLADNRELQGSEGMCHIRFGLAIDGSAPPINISIQTLAGGFLGRQPGTARFKNVCAI